MPVFKQTSETVQNKPISKSETEAIKEIIKVFLDAYAKDKEFNSGYRINYMFYKNNEWTAQQDEQLLYPIDLEYFNKEIQKANDAINTPENAEKETGIFINRFETNNDKDIWEIRVNTFTAGDQWVSHDIHYYMDPKTGEYCKGHDSRDRKPIKENNQSEGILTSIGDFLKRLITSKNNKTTITA